MLHLLLAMASLPARQCEPAPEAQPPPRPVRNQFCIGGSRVQRAGRAGPSTAARALTRAADAPTGGPARARAMAIDVWAGIGSARSAPRAAAAPCAGAGPASLGPRFRPVPNQLEAGRAAEPPRPRSSCASPGDPRRGPGCCAGPAVAGRASAAAAPLLAALPVHAATESVWAPPRAPCVSRKQPSVSRKEPSVSRKELYSDKASPSNNANHHVAPVQLDPRPRRSVHPSEL